MGVGLRMEPYATMCQDDHPELLIFDELCFPDIDKLMDRLGLNWNDFYGRVYEEGRLPHEAALRLLAAVESYQPPPEKLLILLQLYRDWREHPGRVFVQMQGISKGRAPGMEGKSAIAPTRVPG
jgi:hypothetical protein